MYTCTTCLQIYIKCWNLKLKFKHFIAYKLPSFINLLMLVPRLFFLVWFSWWEVSEVFLAWITYIMYLLWFQVLISLKWDENLKLVQSNPSAKSSYLMIDGLIDRNSPSVCHIVIWQHLKIVYCETSNTQSVNKNIGII